MGIMSARKFQQNVQISCNKFATFDKSSKFPQFFSILQASLLYLSSSHSQKKNNSINFRQKYEKERFF